MSRRDTIIIAVLLNAGILAILFMLAIANDEEKINELPSLASEIVKAQEPNQHREFALSTQTQDEELDGHLNDETFLTSQQEPFLPEDEPGFYIEKEAVQNKIPATDSSVSQKNIEITVKRGDVLERIARANNTTVEAIKKANNLKTERVYIGQTLRVPVGTSRSIEKINDHHPVVSGDIVYYTIKSGDNPWKIAKQFHVKFEELLKMNNLDEEKARNLKIGDKIRVR
jgi:peptidoglycan DL-endopeptidase LytF